MKKTIWSRLILCYLIAAVMIFTLLNTFGNALLEDKLKDDKKELLMKEAKLIESEYLTSFYEESLPLPHLKTLLKSISTFLGIRVWIVDANGVITSDSTPNSRVEQKNIVDIDPTFFDKTFTENNDFSGLISEKVMSYTHRVIYNYEIKNYIVLHIPQTKITEDAIYYLDVVNICFLVFLPLLFLLFIYVYYITAIPLQNLTKAAKQYSSGHYNYA